MSRLEFWSRPLIEFDPEDPDHRAYYYDFLQRGTWGYCPYRFIVPDVQGANLINMIQHKMLSYYVSREFEQGARIRNKTVAKKPQKKVSQKAVKLVDTQ